MHPYRCRRNHSGRGYPQGLPRRRRPRWSRQTPWGTLSIPTTPVGYEELVDWANGFGPLEGVGIEGTGSFGAGLARFLQAEGTKIFEVVRPKRREQCRSGKSDPIDAELAARAVLAGTATAQPKGADGKVEMIRTLRVTRRSAVKGCAQSVNQLKNLLISPLPKS